MKNYRPITVLKTEEKVFEQLLASEVTQYIKHYMNNNLTTYCKKNSCQTTLLKLAED